MIAANKAGSFTIMFGVAFAVIYTVATEINLPLVTYHPVIGAVDFLWKPPRTGPAMYWYGWMLTALLGALVLAYGAMLIPETLLQRALVFGAVAALAYLVAYTIALSVYARASVEMEFLKSRWLSVAVAVVLAAIVGGLAPARWNRRLWPGWISLVPIGALAVLGYYLIPFFTR